MRCHPAELIANKRDGRAWSDDQIRDLVAGVVDGSVVDVQLGALLMAVCCRGMSVEETTTLTLAMRDSGRVLQHPGMRAVDKHSTGGVGDKVSLLLAPWVAAAGVPVPMISGRGLGHTGGTIDKLEAIPGYRTALEPDELGQVMQRCGFAMASASKAIAPADARMYAARDVSGTVESVPLITASILAKKLAEGISGLVMDVKCGRAAFMRSRADAERLMQSLVSTGAAAGIDVVALLTDMDQPLGRSAGNALELVEIVDCLNGRGPADLMEVTRALGAEMLVLGGAADDVDSAGARLDGLLAEGKVRDALAANVVAQGGDPAFLENPDVLPRAPELIVVPSPVDGWVRDVSPRLVGEVVRDLGGGRRQPGAAIDPRVGVVLQARRGVQVSTGDPLAWIHAADADAGREAAARITAAIAVGEPVEVDGSRVLARLAS